MLQFWSRLGIFFNLCHKSKVHVGCCGSPTFSTRSLGGLWGLSKASWDRYQKPEILVDDASSLFCHCCQTDWTKRSNCTKDGQIVGVWPVSNWLAWAFLPRVLEGICVASAWWISLEAFMIWACIMYVPGYTWTSKNTWVVLKSCTPLLNSVFPAGI